MAGAGALDQLIVFEAPTIVEDGFGGGATRWSEVVRAWASVKPVSARESERQGAERASTIYMLEMWGDRLDAVHEGCRIRWTSQCDALLNIREIRRPPHRTMKLIMVAEMGVTL
ncbi:MAG: head-tail adaptor protein [Pseudomonadota bacterium]|nr:head-tail adaptor protein [Pseudomonadota bacterium]